MDKYAVILISGKQYLVKEGQELLVDKIKDLKGLEAKVMLLVDGEKATIGKPYVAGVKVGLKVISEMEKGTKLDVYKFKAKSRYRKHIGFRPQYTRLLIEKISK